MRKEGNKKQRCISFSNAIHVIKAKERTIKGFLPFLSLGLSGGSAP